ncbi:MAG: hypothetical protein ACD_51C00355G0004 [uncultured bacterium]|nr:MAG: hypothetical protein ACD_51C00355G0004 [uncultured bacterium]
MYKQPFTSKNQHEAEALVIFCMDFRFHGQTKKFIENFLRIKSYDVVALAGASKNFSDPDRGDDKEVAMKHVRLSVDLHKVKKVILIDHADCGAYGGRKAFAGDPVKEREAHEANLAKAVEVINNEFSSVEVETYYAELVDDDKMVEFMK